MSKVIQIEHCCQCRYCTQHPSSKGICNKREHCHKAIQDVNGPIPEWCKLPDRDAALDLLRELKTYSKHTYGCEAIYTTMHDGKFIDDRNCDCGLTKLKAEAEKLLGGKE